MASTLSLYFQLKGTVNSDLVEFLAGGLYAPVSISLTNDLRYVETCSVADSSATEVLTIGSGSDIASASFIVLIPTVAMTICWELSSAANNSNAEVAANVPFILSTGKAAPYNATPDTSVADTPAAIAQITAYNSSGDTGKLHIFVGS